MVMSGADSKIYVVKKDDIPPFTTVCNKSLAVTICKNATSRASPHLLRTMSATTVFEPLSIFPLFGWLIRVLLRVVASDQPPLLSSSVIQAAVCGRSNVEGRSAGGKTADKLNKHHEGYKTPITDKSKEKSRITTKKLSHNMRRQVLNEKRGMPVINAGSPTSLEGFSLRRQHTWKLSCNNAKACSTR